MRLNSERYAPQPSAAPKSFAILRIYVPVEQEILKYTNGSSILVISNNLIKTVRGSGSTASPLLASSYKAVPCFLMAE